MVTVPQDKGQQRQDGETGPQSSCCRHHRDLGKDGRGGVSGSLDSGEGQALGLAAKAIKRKKMRI